MSPLKSHISAWQMSDFINIKAKMNRQELPFPPGVTYNLIMANIISFLHFMTTHGWAMETNKGKRKRKIEAWGKKNIKRSTRKALRGHSSVTSACSIMVNTGSRGRLLSDQSLLGCDPGPIKGQRPSGIQNMTETNRVSWPTLILTCEF